MNQLREIADELQQADICGRGLDRDAVRELRNKAFAAERDFGRLLDAAAKTGKAVANLLERE